MRYVARALARLLDYSDEYFSIFEKIQSNGMAKDEAIINGQCHQLLFMKFGFSAFWLLGFGVSVSAFVFIKEEIAINI